MAQSGLTTSGVRSNFAPQSGSARWTAPDVNRYLGVALGAFRHWMVLDMRVWSGLGGIMDVATGGVNGEGDCGLGGAFEARVIRWYTYCDTIGLAGDRGGGVVTE